ncbi:MAG: LemA family protein [Deltaproteobacteria bacterium]|nr:LemA family protein [Deltaproteobacteria bacterium]
MKKMCCGIGLGIVGMALLWGVGRYNTFVSEGQNVNQSWAQVENVLQRRNDLIPNLVNVVQAYTIHEQEVFVKVAEARALWNKTVADPNAKIEAKIVADRQLSTALLNVMAVSERYPELKANQNFLALQDELAGTENRIAIERKRFNESVQGYNTFAQALPNNMFAGVFHFPTERAFFKAEEGAGKAPKVEIKYPGVPVPGVTPPPAPPSTTTAP